MGLGTTAARFLSKSPARTAVIGAGVGAAANALRAEDGDRSGAAFRGALTGAALGGAAGGIGRGVRDYKLLNPKAKGMKAVTGAAGHLGTGIANFGKRQVYGLTGIGDPNKMRMAGNATAKADAKLLGLRAKDEIKHAPRSAHAGIRKSLAEEQKSVLSEGRRSQALQDAGVTSLPGTIKGLWNKKTRGKTLRGMGKAFADGPGGIGMSVGVPALMYAPEIARGDESAQGGYSMGQKVYRAGRSIAVGGALGGMPLIPQMVAGTALDMGAEAVENKVMRRRNPAPHLAPGENP